MAGTPTYYDVLQVERDAPPERIRAAYRRLARQYHPDRLPGNANATRAMAAINAAYDILSDAGRRAEHDAWIRRAEMPRRAPPAAPVVPTDVRSFVRLAHGWPWYVLFGTVGVAVGTVGTAVWVAALAAR